MGLEVNVKAVEHIRFGLTRNVCNCRPAATSLGCRAAEGSTSHKTLPAPITSPEALEPWWVATVTSRIGAAEDRSLLVPPRRDEQHLQDRYRRDAGRLRGLHRKGGDLRDHPDTGHFDGVGHWTTGPVEWGGNPADLYRQGEFLDRFMKCLSELSPNHANAFTLREIDGLGTAEICKVLGVSETNLWVILHRATAELPPPTTTISFEPL